MPFDKSRPYNELPDLPPQVSVETHTVLKKAIGAHKALSELKQIGHRLPKQAILIHSLGLQEAKMSSEIESIVTTNDELYQAHAHVEHALSPETKEVLHYQDAIWHGYEALKSNKRLLTTPLFEEICQIVIGNSNCLRESSGTKLVNASGEVMYTPPEGELLIRKMLHNLEEFIYQEKNLDSLVKLALIHYQFEAIHPFYDGNGRTGRILNILYLINEGLLDLPVLYLSRYFLHNKKAYYQGFRNVAEKEHWEEWISFFLDAVNSTAKMTQQKITTILDLMENVTAQIQEKAPEIYSKELIDVIFKMPYCKIRHLEEAKIAKRQTASIYLQQLETMGLLQGIKKGREKYYINSPFLKLLAQ